VANFYKHKHYEQEPKCDLIIAWQNTSKKKDFPVLVLNEIQGSYVYDLDDFNEEIDYYHLFEILLQSIGFCFPHRKLHDLVPISFLIMGRYAKMVGLTQRTKLYIHYKNCCKDDEIALQSLCTLFDIKEKLPIYFEDIPKEIDNFFVYEYTFNIIKSQNKKFDFISELPYLQNYILKNHLNSYKKPFPLINKDAITFVMNKCDTIKKCNLYIILASIWSFFKQKNIIEAQDLADILVFTNSVNINSI